MYGILKTQLNNMMRIVSTTATTIETTMTTTNTRKYLQTNTTNTHFLQQTGGQILYNITYTTFCCRSTLRATVGLGKNSCHAKMEA